MSKNTVNDSKRFPLHKIPLQNISVVNPSVLFTYLFVN